MSLRIMVVGGGGREHALLWKLAQSARTGSLLCAPGNAGTSELAEPVAVKLTDPAGIVAAAAAQQVDLVVVGPEEPLASGVADQLRDAGIPCFGPSAAAARIESSKAFAKDVMLAANVPTARAEVVTNLVLGVAALSSFDLPVVIKADGLAAGKGVVICTSRDEAVLALTALLEDGVLGAAGRTVVIEEYLSGQEVSVFGITDGETVVTLMPSRDHKRAHDRDLGPNTGGMGAFSPVPDLDEAWTAQVRRDVMEPTIREMAARGTPFQGVLYAGIMLTEHGPKVLEFNARFGDPETQVVLPLLDADLTELVHAVAHGTLSTITPPELFAGAAVGVVLASGGYPGPYQTGVPISGLESVPDDVLVFHAGTRRDDSGRVVTHGGRVLAVVGQGTDHAAARDRAYAGAEMIQFARRHYRTDIARFES